LASSLLRHGASLSEICVCQLDLAPFDALIWPHLILVVVRLCRRPRGSHQT
jgi:hypothetical protein